METPNDDYDSPWKEAVEHYFPEFMAFYFPEAHASIDWSRDYVFLDQELQTIARDAGFGKRFVDKLVGVTLLNGDENWCYIHIEVQGTKQAEFAERMFVYNYRLYDRYRRPIASLAVLADEDEQWKPACFGFEILGCKHTLEFPVAKLTDYRIDQDDLQEADNAFALITAAHFLTRQTRKNSQDRYEAKLSLIRILYRRRWDKQRIIDLFTVLDWLMRLPADLEKQIWREIETIEETGKMRYITSVERIGIAKGLLEGESKLLRKLLTSRFGALPAWASDKLDKAGEQDLESWAEAVLTAPTLDAVFGGDANH